MGYLGAFLERSGAYLEAIFEEHRTEGERKSLDSRKIVKTTMVFVVFLKFPRFQHEASWGCFWGHLGGLGAILGASWASWRPLGGVLTASWDVWECLGTLRSIRPFWLCLRAGPGFLTTRSSGGIYTFLGPTVNSLSLQVDT